MPKWSGDPVVHLSRRAAGEAPSASVADNRHDHNRPTHSSAADDVRAVGRHAAPLTGCRSGGVIPLHSGRISRPIINQWRYLLLLHRTAVPLEELEAEAMLISDLFRKSRAGPAVVGVALAFSGFRRRAGTKRALTSLDMDTM